MAAQLLSLSRSACAVAVTVAEKEQPDATDKDLVDDSLLEAAETMKMVMVSMKKLYIACASFEIYEISSYNLAL